MNPLLSVQSISKTGEESRQLLADLAFDVDRGERLAIVGETGSGKSTLLKSIAGLSEINSGKVLFNDEEVEGPEKKLVAGHQGICYLSQHFELPKFITVRNFLDRQEQINVDDPTLIYQACRINGLLDRDTRALSGGEKQRVALTKELLKAPKLLLLDEPFSNLDFNHKRIIREVMDEVEKDLAVTIVMVAHDPKDVLSWAHKILVMGTGKIVQLDHPERVFNQPVNTYVASLFGAYSLIDPGPVDPDSFHLLEGKVFLRSHQVSVAHRATNLMSGKVAQIKYYGAYDEVMIDSEFGVLFTQTKVGALELDAPVHFQIGK